MEMIIIITVYIVNEYDVIHYRQRWIKHMQLAIEYIHVQYSLWMHTSRFGQRATVIANFLAVHLLA